MIAELSDKASKSSAIGPNQKARSSLSSRRGGAARQAGTHSNRVARPILQTSGPLQCFVGEFDVEELFLSQVESKTVDVHGIDLFRSPAAPALSRQRCCLCLFPRQATLWSKDRSASNPAKPIT